MNYAMELDIGSPIPQNMKAIVQTLIARPHPMTKRENQNHGEKEHIDAILNQRIDSVNMSINKMTNPQTPSPLEEMEWLKHQLEDKDADIYITHAFGERVLKNLERLNAFPVLVEALRLALTVAQDAVTQQGYPGGKRSYFDEKWEWQEDIDKAKAALKEVPKP